jgi:hypothetical protein
LKRCPLRESQPETTEIASRAAQATTAQFWLEERTRARHERIREKQYSNARERQEPIALVTA